MTDTFLSKSKRFANLANHTQLVGSRYISKVNIIVNTLHYISSRLAHRDPQGGFQKKLHKMAEKTHCSKQLKTGSADSNPIFQKKMEIDEKIMI